MYQYQNPVNDFYFRQSQPQFNFPPQPMINYRFVTNVEEARTSLIDGFSYNIFLDSSNGKIYLKKVNNNGMSDFLTYSVEEGKQADPIGEINTTQPKYACFRPHRKNRFSESYHFFFKSVRLCVL